MSTLFFGDSLTAGSNCDCKYTDFLPSGWGVHNHAISGTTIGNYSIYPVDGYSLLDRIEKYRGSIEGADTIFIEYGSNDVSAIMCGFATEQTVIISLVKALDWIKQLNPKAKVIFLIPGTLSVVESIAKSMCNYLENDYFGKFDFKFPVSKYVSIFSSLLENIKKLCQVMYMFDESMLSDDYISDDNIHPNAKGHRHIAQNIIQQFHF